MIVVVRTSNDVSRRKAVLTSKVVIGRVTHLAARMVALVLALAILVVALGTLVVVVRRVLEIRPRLSIILPMVGRRGTRRHAEA